MRSEAEVMLDRWRQFGRLIQDEAVRARAEGEAAVAAMDLDAAVAAFTRARILLDSVAPAAQRAADRARYNPIYLKNRDR